MGTLFENENEWQRIELVPGILGTSLVKTRNNKSFYNWTSELIPFIDEQNPDFCFEMSKVAFFIVIKFSYNDLWPFFH